ncbi:Protein of uncharacterised function (DUF2637) [Mycobacteroides abscessus subsp. abscessus]|uniref:DUF2637 domain-containing protein n=1 Tax=Mycobacteroides abscessus TaxID=36809 RepID=UPI000925F312|nr:DUF2637 domain-containing protein [Mycobacteroides abscessus]MDM2347786.1 DUF2637 domain-containing protein [Mycobacteroides abscessus]MDM2361310.1 DUF2637 domain-containing protein [Mycobacteroides abscessus]QSN52500.1 DUF2637 domain-containing protein [Mycobacteroides abscessus subsp. abscessus]SIH26018.1 Protein of uncharacterised function (DUF2637) [Mycobacteroides abscessus subsp. abscessus]SII60369.1 Protein of uncharacterised function (DUF2637) [Mycobacteroides abscessus subsp. absce
MSARAWFGSTLLASTVVSLAGNIGYTLIARPNAHTAVSIAVAAVAPLGLAAAVHSVGVAARARGAVRAVVLTAVAVVAVSAFVLSFEALAGLARLVGHTGWTAYLLPVVVDVMVAASTTALVLERPQHLAREAEVTIALAAGAQAPAAVPVAPVPDDALVSAGDEIKVQVKTMDDRAAAAVAVPAAQLPAASMAQDDHLPAAERLVAAGAVKGPAIDVAVAMAALAAGRSQRAAAAASGLHRTTVARLMSEVSPDQTGSETVT